MNQFRRSTILELLWRSICCPLRLRCRLGGIWDHDSYEVWGVLEELCRPLFCLEVEPDTPVLEIYIYIYSTWYPMPQDVWSWYTCLSILWGAHSGKSLEYVCLSLVASLKRELHKSRDGRGSRDRCEYGGFKTRYGQWSKWCDWKALTESKASLWWRHDGRQREWCRLGIFSQMVSRCDITILTIIQTTSGRGIGSHCKSFHRFMTTESPDLLALCISFTRDLWSESILS